MVQILLCFGYSVQLQLEVSAVFSAAMDILIMVNSLPYCQLVLGPSLLKNFWAGSGPEHCVSLQSREFSEAVSGSVFGSSW